MRCIHVFGDSGNYGSGREEIVRKNVDISKLNMHVIKNIEIAFIINPKTGTVNRSLGFIVAIGEPSEKVQ